MTDFTGAFPTLTVGRSDIELPGDIFITIESGLNLSGEKKPMLTSDELRGIHVAIVTPFTEKDEVDVDGLRELVDFYISRGIHGIMTTGGNGEFPHLLPEERRMVLETVVDSVRGRVPVIACTSACSVKEIVLYMKHAESAGADAAIVVQPYYFNLPGDRIFEYYREVAGSTDLPIVIYNNPIPPALMVKLLEMEKVIGLKQSEYDISQLVEITRLVGDTASIMTGIDSQLYPALCLGAREIFSTAACVIPDRMVRRYETFVKGDTAGAFRMFMERQVLNRFFEYDQGYVAPCKGALRMMGLPAGHVRPPLSSLSEDERSELREAML